MTFRQMQYALTIFKCGSFSEAAKRLYVSQSSISEAVHTLEEELGFPIFERGRSGVTVTPEGENFLSDTADIIQQMDVLESKYGRTEEEAHFSVSTVHYYFTASAFAKLVNEIEGREEQYKLRILDSSLLQILDDVEQKVSEIGMIGYVEKYDVYIRRELQKRRLEFCRMMKVKTHIFVGAHHELAERESVKLEELENYPYLTSYQGQGASSFFAEEGFFVPQKKMIYTRDTNTLTYLLKTTNAFSMGSGIISDGMTGGEIKSVPLGDTQYLYIGWIQKSRAELSDSAKRYLEFCREELEL